MHRSTTVPPYFTSSPHLRYPLNLFSSSAELIPRHLALQPLPPTPSSCSLLTPLFFLRASPPAATHIPATSDRPLPRVHFAPHPRSLTPSAYSLLTPQPYSTSDRLFHAFPTPPLSYEPIFFFRPNSSPRHLAPPPRSLTPIFPAGFTACHSPHSTSLPTALCPVSIFSHILTPSRPFFLRASPPATTHTTRHFQPLPLLPSSTSNPPADSISSPLTKLT